MAENRHDSGKNLELTRQQVSHVIAALLLTGFFIFIAGYYYGKRIGSQPFQEQMESDALADRMYAAVCAINDYSEKEEPESESDDPQVAQQAIPSVEPEIAPKQNNTGLWHYAQIAGYGSFEAALKCKERILKGFDTLILKQAGKTAKGKERVWYQVVTKPTHDQHLLAQDLESIKKVAKLQKLTPLTLDQAQHNQVVQKIITQERRI